MRGGWFRSARPTPALLKATGKTVVFQNAWLFEVATGRLVSAQLYADTAAVRSNAT
jgi:ketosteroid isomerase-like protein